MSVPSVFEADLPTVEYEDAPSPAEAHRNLRKALEQAPIALGAHGPEILSYELVRTTLRDSRFQVPRGLGLEAQNITDGPLWDRATSSLLAMNGCVRGRDVDACRARRDDRCRHRAALPRADHLRLAGCAS